MAQCNPALGALITKCLGSDKWVRDLSLLDVSVQRLVTNRQTETEHLVLLIVVIHSPGLVVKSALMRVDDGHGENRRLPKTIKTRFFLTCTYV